jgi:hypothetical protein
MRSAPAEGVVDRIALDFRARITRPEGFQTPDLMDARAVLAQR